MKSLVCLSVLQRSATLLLPKRRLIVRLQEVVSLGRPGTGITQRNRLARTGSGIQRQHRIALDRQHAVLLAGVDRFGVQLPGPSVGTGWI